MQTISTVSTILPQAPVQRKSNRIRKKRHFSTNPQHSSSSQGQKSKNKVKTSCNDEPCGNVGKVHKPKETISLPELPCGKRCGPAWKTGKACREQVFSNEESAQNTARSFKEHFGVEYFVARCSKCGLIHLEIVRHE